MAEAGQRVLEEALAVGPAVGDPAGHGGQEGGVGRAPEPGNATHGRRSLQGRLRGVDSLHGIVPRRVGVTVPIPGVRTARSTASGTRRSPRSASPTCGRARPTAHDGFTSLALAAAWTPVAPRRRGHRTRVHPRPRAARADRGVDGRRRARTLRARDRRVVARDRRALERDPVRAIPSAAPATCCASSAARSPARRSPSATRPSRSRASGSAIVPEEPPPVLVAALRPGMLRLAGEEGDGAIVNWLSADDVTQVAPYVGDKEIVARIFVVPSDDFDAVRSHGGASDHELPDRRRLRRVPAVAGPRSRAHSRCGTHGPRVTAPGAVELVPDEVDRRPHRVGHARADPRARRALRRARRDHHRARDPLRPRAGPGDDPRPAPNAQD